MAHPPNNFLIPPTTSTDVALAQLTEDAYFKDGSKVMEGAMTLGSNVIRDVEALGLNELAAGLQPVPGEVNIYAKSDSLLYSQDDAKNEILLSGGLSGAGSSTDNAIVRWDTTTGLLLQDSVLTISDTGNIQLSLTDYIHSKGTNNFAGGLDALGSITSGVSNTALGANALNAATTTNENVGVGHDALALCTASSNTAVGFEALAANVSGDSSTALGYQSLNVNTASGNTACGFRSLFSNTSGSSNSAFGNSALRACITGVSNTAVGSFAGTGLTGSQNTAMGLFSLNAANATDDNTAIGYESLSLSTSGENTAVGSQSLRNLSTGVQNTGIGYHALFGLITNSDCVAVGHNALNACTGGQNVAVGSLALDSLTSGTDCVAVGYNALTANTAVNNTAVGSQAMNSNTTGLRNIGIGKLALSGIISNDDCVAVGYNALLLATGGQNTAVGSLSLDAITSGMNCVAVGYDALSANTASDNTAIGSESLASNTSGLRNTAVGRSTLSTQITGDDCVGIGHRALVLATGNNNTAIGSQALDSLTSGINCVAVGYNALTANTASSNTAVGSGALDSVTTGTNNIGLGLNAGGSLATSDSDNICIGNVGTSGDSAEIRIGTVGTHEGTFLAGAFAVPEDQYETPLTGTTVLIVASTSTCIIDPAGTLAALTINMPASPKDGCRLCITITQNINSITHSGNGNTLQHAFSSSGITKPSSGIWYFRNEDTTWYNCSLPPSFEASFAEELTLSYTSASTVTVSAGACRDSTNSEDINLLSNTVCNIASSGAGGLDTGSEAAGTWYSVYVISGGSGNLPNTLMSVSATSPTLPGTYTVFRRIGWVRNQTTSSNFLNFNAVGSGKNRLYTYNEAVDAVDIRVLVGGGATTATNIDLSSGVPSTSRYVMISAVWDGANPANTCDFNKGGVSITKDLSMWQLGLGSTNTCLHNIQIPCDSSQVITYEVDNGSDSLDASICGWFDNI